MTLNLLRYVRAIVAVLMLPMWNARNLAVCSTLRRLNVLYKDSSHRVDVLLPSGYDESTPDAARTYPLVVLLHGFCVLGPSQENLTMISVSGQYGEPTVKVTQAGLADLVDTRGFIYVQPPAPNKTKDCELCITGDPRADTFAASMQALVAFTPAGCRAWKTDVCCRDGDDVDDVAYILEVIRAVK
eukprot:gene17741-21134_t